MRAFNIIHVPYGRQNKNENRLLADEVFERALLKMLNIVTISLGKKYWVSGITKRKINIWNHSLRRIVTICKKTFHVLAGFRENDTTVERKWSKDRLQF